MPTGQPNPDVRFYVRDGDHIDGPHPRARILEWHREGRLPDDVLLSRDGQTWRRVRWPAEPGRAGVGKSARRRG